MMRKEFFLLFILLVSGCTTTSTGSESKGPATSEGSYGLVVKEFSSDVATIEEGDTATLIVSFENVDEVIAENIYAKLYAVGLKNTDDEETLSELEPNNTDFFTFDVEAPKNLNLDRVYTPYVDLCYDYSSFSSTSSFVVDLDVYEMDKVPALSSTKSKAALQIDISLSNELQKVDVSEGLGKDRTLSIDLTNVDTGKVIDGTETIGEEHKLPPGSIKISIPLTTGAVVTVNDLRDEFACSVNEDFDVTVFDESSSDEDKGLGLSVGEEGNPVFCKNVDSVSLGSRGEGKTLRLGLNFNISENNQDVVFLMGTVDYRYCIQTDQITLTAKKIV